MSEAKETGASAETTGSDHLDDLEDMARHAVSSTDLLGLLNAAGYRTVEGFDAVRAAIASESDGSTEQLCSGYGVLPDGPKCGGCRDCSPNGLISCGAKKKG